MPSFFIPWHEIPLIPPLKMTIKVIYSHGIKVFYGGIVFESLWYCFVLAKKLPNLRFLGHIWWINMGKIWAIHFIHVSR
jgi:hypothetical protein